MATSNRRLATAPAAEHSTGAIETRAADLIDRKISALEVMHYNIGARLSKTKIKCMHVYNYADIVPLVDDHTLISAEPIR